MVFPLRLAPTFILLAVAACSPLHVLQDSHVAEQQGFAADLATEYLGFAESESAQGRKEAAEYFAEKGLRTRDGQDVLPEKPRALQIAPGDAREDLQGARRRLLSLRNDLVEGVASQRLARAQVLYDCWVYQESAHQSALADDCRNGFLTEIRQLETILPAGKEKAAHTLPASFTLYFNPGSAKLDRDAYYVIEQVRQLTHSHSDYAIDVSGHTDSVGPAEENRALSQKRAEAVTRALIDAGIAAERITTAWLGEDDPHTPALDGTPRKENRRVEIDVSPHRSPPEKQGVAAQE